MAATTGVSKYRLCSRCGRRGASNRTGSRRSSCARRDHLRRPVRLPGGQRLAIYDTITSVGGQTVNSATDIEQILVKYHPGDKISISWLDQSGQSQTTTVTLASGPAA